MHIRHFMNIRKMSKTRITRTEILVTDNDTEFMNIEIIYANYIYF